MQRHIAYLLVMVMSFGVFQGVTFGQKTIEIKMNALGLEELSVEKYDSSGNISGPAQGIGYNAEASQLELKNNPKEDEVVVSWPVDKESERQFGTYTLEYFLEDIVGSADGTPTAETRKIQVDFFVGKENKDLDGNPTNDSSQFTENTDGITVQIRNMNSEDGVVDAPTTYTDYKQPYGSNDTEDIVTDTVYTTFLDIKESALSDAKENVVSVGGTAKLSFFYRDGNIVLSTTGVDKGLVIPFKLAYTSLSGLKQTAQINAFKGLNTFEITPTHLIPSSNALGFESKEEIVQLSDSGMGQELPGGKPGVKIEIVKPKVIKGDGAGEEIFIPIDEGALNQDSPDANTDTFANLHLVEILGDNTAETPALEIKLKFDFRDGAAIYMTEGNETSTEAAGFVRSEEESLTIYLSKTIKGLEGKGIIELEGLEAGMFLSGELALNGNYFSEPAPPVVDSTSEPDRVGYTYIQYKAKRSGANTITFDVEPYNFKGPVSYTLMRESGQAGTWQAIDIRQYETKPDTDKITLVSHLEAGDVRYKIQIKTGTDVFESQILVYNANNEAIPAPYTEIIDFENIYVVPNEDINNNPDSNAHTKPEAVGFDLIWRAPDHASLISLLEDKRTIYYELNMGIDKNIKEEEIIKVFKVSLDDQGQVLVEVHQGEVGSEENKIGVYKQGIGGEPGTFIIRDLVLKHKSDESQDKWLGLTMPEGYTTGSNYPTPDQIVEEPLYTYPIPDTFYFTMRAIYDTAEEDIRLGVSEYSAIKSLVFDNVYEIIPIPQGIRAESLTLDAEETIFGGKIEFNYVDLRAYIQKMLEPAELTLKDPREPDQEGDRRIYEIYLYQDFGADQPKLEDESKQKVVTVEEESEVMITEEMKAHLRQEGHFIRLEYKDYMNLPNQEDDMTGDKINLDIQGLDPNTPYSIQVRVRVDLWRLGEEPVESYLDPRYSTFSKIVTFTTLTKPVPPTPDEQAPPAPSEFFEIEPRPSGTSVQLGWEGATSSEGDVENIYYELIRSESKTLDEAYLKKGVSLEDLIELDQADAQVAHKYFHTEDDYIQVYENAWQELAPRQNSDMDRLVDSDLLPNTVYYYYIRSVSVGEGKKGYSSWISLPITTVPVQAPINLILESAKSFTYNTSTEAVISFWAPIPKTAVIPTEFNFDIAIRGEDDAEFQIANATKYEAHFVQEIALEDAIYRKFVYKIEDLEHGRRYDIKVRIRDNTHGTSEVVASAYSETLVIRTEFSDTEQDKENAFDEYLEKYDIEAEKLKKQSYWEVNAGRYENVYKYRGNYLKPDLSNDSMYPLVSPTNAEAGVYYLTRDIFQTAEEENTTFKVVIDDYEAYLRPGILKGNDAIEDAEERIEKGEIADYYIKIEMELSDLTGKIQGNKVLSPEIFIDMEIVDLEQKDLIIEDTILDELLQFIARGREQLIVHLEREVQEDYIDKDRLEELITDEIEWVKEQHQEEVREILDDMIEDEDRIRKITEAVLILGKIEGNHVEAYTVHDLIPMTVFSSLGGYAFETTELGSFVFTSGKSIDTYLPGLAGAEGLISKYMLTDFFDFTASGLEQSIQRSELHGVLARVLGARRGTDYTQYLLQRGLDVISPYQVQGYVRTDEVIYMVMQAYEKMYYKPVESITITNKQSVMNIGAFQPKYRPYTYAAVQLGVIEPKNQKVSPTQTRNVKELIKMIVAIMPR